MFTLVAHARVQHSLDTKAASTLGVCARLPEHSTCWTLRQRPLLLPVYVAWVYYTLDTKAALPLVARARLPGYTTCWTLRQRPLLLPVYVARVFYTLDTKAALPLVACARLSEYSTLMWTHPTVRIRTRCRCPIAWSRRCSRALKWAPGPCMWTFFDSYLAVHCFAYPLLSDITTCCAQILKWRLTCRILKEWTSCAGNYRH